MRKIGVDHNKQVESCAAFVEGVGTGGRIISKINELFENLQWISQRPGLRP